MPYLKFYFWSYGRYIGAPGLFTRSEVDSLRSLYHDIPCFTIPLSGVHDWGCC